MNKTLIFLAAVPMFAMPAVAETFTADGIAYTYSVRQTGKFRIIDGTDSNQHPFRLRVSDRRVDGWVNGRAVSFALRDVVRTKPAHDEVASR